MKPAKAIIGCTTALTLVLCLVACGSNAPSDQANQVAVALQGLATDPVTLVSSQASAEVRDNIEQLFVPGSIVRPDVASWAPDGPNRGTMVVTVEPPDQEPQTVIVVVILEDSAWKILDVPDEVIPPPPSDSPETELKLKPMVFELIGQPPEPIERQLGEWDYVSSYDGIHFVYEDYEISFTDYTGEWDSSYRSGPRPAGVCWSFEGKLEHIVDGPPGPIGVADLNELFGETGEVFEPVEGSFEPLLAFGGIVYSYRGVLVSASFSEDTHGEHFVAESMVYVWDPDLAYQACLNQEADQGACEGW
ncbi:MAG: hypothetical protein FWD29_07970 [Micrococcales bacterium]|nr:hypothetical protein [Micrococcales bacterium]